tara:strand:- start:611 stop:1279 length:669 start_codon:yes stop_codon:yes gene_type:complete
MGHELRYHLVLSENLTVTVCHIFCPENKKCVRMPRYYSLPFHRAHARGALCRILFTREADDCLVSVNVHRTDGERIPEGHRVEVRTLSESGSTIASIALQAGGDGTLQRGLSVLRVGPAQRFQVAVVVPRELPYRLDGTLTVLHGLDATGTVEMRQSFHETKPRSRQIEPLGYGPGMTQPVPPSCQAQIAPIYRRRGGSTPNYLVPIWQLEPDYNCDKPIPR